MNNRSWVLFLYGKKEYGPDEFVSKIKAIECICEDDALQLIKDKSIDYNGKSSIHFKDGHIKYFKDYGEECDFRYRDLKHHQAKQKIKDKL